jgi:hypothetical protein
MINNLTQEQEAQIKPTIKKWLDLRDNPKPLDFEKVREGTKWFYGLFKKPEPITLIARNPLEMQLMAKMAVAVLSKSGSNFRDHLRDQLWELEEQLGDQLRDQLGNQPGEELWDQLWDQLGEQLEDRLEDLGPQLRDQISNRPLYQLKDQLEELRDQLEDQLEEQLEDQLGEQLEEQFWNQLGDQPEEQLRRELWDQFRDQLWEFGRELWQEFRNQRDQSDKNTYFPPLFSGNTMDVRWISYYGFILDNLAVSCPEELKEKFSKIREFTENGILMFVQFEGLCVVCPMPSQESIISAKKKT